MRPFTTFSAGRFALAPSQGELDHLHKVEKGLVEKSIYPRHDLQMSITGIHCSEKDLGVFVREACCTCGGRLKCVRLAGRDKNIYQDPAQLWRKMDLVRRIV